MVSSVEGGVRYVPTSSPMLVQPAIEVSGGPRLTRRSACNFRSRYSTRPNRARIVLAAESAGGAKGPAGVVCEVGGRVNSLERGGVRHAIEQAAGG